MPAGRRSRRHVGMNAACYFRDAEIAKDRRGRKELFSGFFDGPVRVVVMFMIGHHEAAQGPTW